MFKEKIHFMFRYRASARDRRANRLRPQLWLDAAAPRPYISPIATTEFLMPGPAARNGG
jgi:hypothetical protein